MRQTNIILWFIFCNTEALMLKVVQGVESDRIFIVYAFMMLAGYIAINLPSSKQDR